MSSTSADSPSVTGSSLLRQSPPFRAHPIGPGGADLSLSELYIGDQPEDVPDTIPFSLLPQRAERAEEEVFDEEETVLNGLNALPSDADEDDATTAAKGKQPLNQSRTREERLQHDLFVLKKLNASFSLYNEALKDTKSSTENIALQIDRTDRLLSQYVKLLQHTEKNSQLIFDELWQGGSADQETLERLHAEATLKAEREREERERAARLEQERREKEEQERILSEERKAKSKDKWGTAPVRGVRGVRGLRARGVERGASAASRGGIPSASNTTASRGVPENPRGSAIVRGRRS